MFMKVGKWNYKKREYEDYELPIGAKLYSDDMDEFVSCAECGNKLKFGECYTSKRIHGGLGFGYGVCEKCYSNELLIEREYLKE